MADSDLSQSEADSLLAMEKLRLDTQRWQFPGLGGSLAVPLASRDKREQFVLDVWRSQIDLQKTRYQNRARQVIILARLDLAGAPHRNPAGQEIGVPHLHVYRQGFADKWAFEPPPDIFQNLWDSKATIYDFMRYCNIVEPPVFEWDLFS